MSLKLLTMRQLTNVRYEVKRQHASMLADAEEIMARSDGEYDSVEFVSICKEIKQIEKEIERVNREITRRDNHEFKTDIERVKKGRADVEEMVEKWGARGGAFLGLVIEKTKLKPRRGIGSY